MHLVLGFQFGCPEMSECWQINNSNWTATAYGSWCWCQNCLSVRQFQFECSVFLCYLHKHMYLYWIDETMFLSFQLWFVWAHALCDRETTLGGRSALVRLCWQLPSKPCALKTTIDYEFVMIIDSFIKWWDREQMLGHILMQWINSIPFIIRWIK